VQLVLVRHGHAEPKQVWLGQDVDRPLVARGRRQAELLARNLVKLRPTRIISSPSLRCLQTVQPLGRRSGLDVEVLSWLGTDAGEDAREGILGLSRNEPSSARVVLCTHREVLVDVLPYLAETFGVKLGHRLPGAKGGMWILEIRKKKLARVAYRATQ
jgi:phosphohistidine phosphatase SixA